MAMHSVYPVIVSEKSTAVQKKVQVNADKLAVCLIGKRDLQVGPSAHPEAAEPEPGAKAGCTAAPEQARETVRTSARHKGPFV